MRNKGAHEDEGRLLRGQIVAFEALPSKLKRKMNDFLQPENKRQEITSLDQEFFMVGHLGGVVIDLVSEELEEVDLERDVGIVA